MSTSIERMRNSSLGTQRIRELDAKLFFMVGKMIAQLNAPVAYVRYRFHQLCKQFRKCEHMMLTVCKKHADKKNPKKKMNGENLEQN